MAARKAAAKDTGATGATAGANQPSISVALIPKMTVSMPLDDRKIKAIQKCIAKGTLTMTLSRIDLASGRLGDGWLYD